MFLRINFGSTVELSKLVTMALFLVSLFVEGNVIFKICSKVNF